MLPPLCAAPAASAQLSSVEQLAWFTGCWQTTQGDRVIDEQWMAPGGGLMLGMSRTVRAGRAMATEFVTLRAVAGRFVYEANPSGQQPTPFTATVCLLGPRRFRKPCPRLPQTHHLRAQGRRWRSSRRLTTAPVRNAWSIRTTVSPAGSRIRTARNVSFL